MRVSRDGTTATGATWCEDSPMIARLVSSSSGALRLVVDGWTTADIASSESHPSFFSSSDFGLVSINHEIE